MTASESPVRARDDHHLACRRCGAVKHVDCAAGHGPCLEPVNRTGFVVDETNVTFWGLCPTCRTPGGTPA